MRRVPAVAVTASISISSTIKVLLINLVSRELPRIQSLLSKIIILLIYHAASVVICNTDNRRIKSFR